MRGGYVFTWLIERERETAQRILGNMSKLVLQSGPLYSWVQLERNYLKEKKCGNCPKFNLPLSTLKILDWLSYF